MPNRRVDGRVAALLAQIRLHQLEIERPQSRRAPVDPLGPVVRVEVHLHETGVDLAHPGYPPLAVPLGLDDLAPLQLDHRPFRIGLHVLLDEVTRLHGYVLPDAGRALAHEEYVLVLDVLGVAVVEEDKVSGGECHLFLFIESDDTVTGSDA